jgi:selenocysteine lyase/cysteine desulfurase
VVVVGGGVVGVGVVVVVVVVGVLVVWWGLFWLGGVVGVLYAKAGIQDRLPSYKVRPSAHRFSTGTPNLEGIAGTLAAIEYIASIAGGSGDRRARIVASMSAVAEYERTLSKRFLDGIVTLPGVRVWGITDQDRLTERTPTFAITSDRHSPHEMAQRLGEAGILAWDGHFYAQGLIERLGLAPTGGVLRLGFVHYTTTDEVDRTLDELEAILAH